jgi:hypothetical protein
VHEATASLIVAMFSSVCEAKMETMEGTAPDDATRRRAERRSTPELRAAAP